MNLVVAVMSHAWRVVCYENINFGKVSQRLFHLRLLKKKVAFGFVLPRATKAAERNTENAVGGKVKISD
jgi:hypothetical protein